MSKESHQSGIRIPFMLKFLMRWPDSLDQWERAASAQGRLTRSGIRAICWLIKLSDWPPS
jgi:hypothetical protein